MIWRIGIGFRAGSRVLVRKSKRSFGQRREEREAASWSGFGEGVGVSCWLLRCAGRGRG